MNLKKLLTLMIMVIGFSNIEASQYATVQFEVKAKVDLNIEFGVTCMAIGSPPAPTFHIYSIDTEKYGKIILGSLNSNDLKYNTSLVLLNQEINKGDVVMVKGRLNLLSKSFDNYSYVKVVETARAKLSCFDEKTPVDGVDRYIDVKSRNGTYKIDFKESFYDRMGPKKVENTKVLAQNLKCSFDPFERLLLECHDENGKLIVYTELSRKVGFKERITFNFKNGNKQQIFKSTNCN